MSARKTAASLDQVQVLKDIAFLIAQLDTIEHAQDRDAIATVAKRYGIKRAWE